jgi:hypothetical protein
LISRNKNTGKEETTEDRKKRKKCHAFCPFGIVAAAAIVIIQRGENQTSRIH